MWNELGVGAGGRRGEGSGKGGSRASAPGIFLGLLSSCTRMCAAGAGAGVSKGPRQPRISPLPLFWLLSHFMVSNRAQQMAGVGMMAKKGQSGQHSHGSCCCC